MFTQITWLLEHWRNLCNKYNRENTRFIAYNAVYFHHVLIMDYWSCKWIKYINFPFGSLSNFKDVSFLITLFCFSISVSIYTKETWVIIHSFHWFFMTLCLFAAKSTFQLFQFLKWHDLLSREGLEKHFCTYEQKFKFVHH